MLRIGYWKFPQFNSILSSQAMKFPLQDFIININNISKLWKNLKGNSERLEFEISFGYEIIILRVSKPWETWKTVFNSFLEIKQLEVSVCIVCFEKEKYEAWLDGNSINCNQKDQSFWENFLYLFGFEGTSTSKI